MKYKTIIICVTVGICTISFLWLATEGKISGGGFISISPDKQYRLDVIKFRRLFGKPLVCTTVTDISSGKELFQYTYLSNGRSLSLRGQKDKKIVWVIDKGTVEVYYRESTDTRIFNTCLSLNYKTQEMQYERLMRSSP